MKNLILLLSLIYFAQAEAYKVETFGQTNDRSFYSGLVKGYERTSKWKDLAVAGDLDNGEVNTLLKGQSGNYQKRLLHCKRKYEKISGNPSKRYKNSSLKNDKICALEFRKAMKEFMNNYNGSVADSVIRSALEALKKLNPKAYTVER